MKRFYFFNFLSISTLFAQPAEGFEVFGHDTEWFQLLKILLYKMQ